ncbi:MAG: O-methyltransferase [Elusimicrobiota bacterium]|nr:O-methyltransferase [Elusimicrobiota bacterium]
MSPARPTGGHAAAGDQVYRAPALLDFVTGLVAREDETLRAIREETPRHGIPAISVGPDEGRILHFLVTVVGARKVVEVGTLAGYSAAWMARALPAGGRLDTVEFDPKHAAVARENLKKAGVADKATVHLGAGSAVLPTLEKHAPYDLCFIDADKPGYPDYARWAAKCVRSGGLVVCDNAYLFGKLHREDLPPSDEDAPKAPRMRECLRLLTDESLFSSCAMLPTGEGMAVAVRR